LRLADFKVDLLAAYYAAILRTCRFIATSNVEKLHEPVRLLDRNLGDPTIWMKDVKNIPLCHSLAGQISHKQS